MAMGRLAGLRAWVAGLWVIGRAAVGLFVHCLARPGTPATLSRATGKVAPQ